MRNLKVSPFDPEELRRNEYDLAIGSAGFERRARYIIEEFQPKAAVAWAPAFVNRQVLEFDRNNKVLSGLGYDTTPVDDGSFRDHLDKKIQQSLGNSDHGSSIRVVVDVSSMSRLRMATIVDAFRFLPHKTTVHIDFVYSVSAFAAPPKENLPIVECGPVTPEFAGWSYDPSLSAAAVFGAGYEQDQVIGVLDLLEAAEVWVFVPDGPDGKYLQSVNEANETLWEEVPENQRFYYKVLRPFETFTQVESLLYGLRARRRPVVVPFGPKSFTVVCLLACASLGPQIPVWRVSTGQSETPEDRIGTSDIAGISAEFAKDCT